MQKNVTKLLKINKKSLQKYAKNMSKHRYKITQKSLKINCKSHSNIIAKITQDSLQKSLQIHCWMLLRTLIQGHLAPGHHSRALPHTGPRQWLEGQPCTPDDQATHQRKLILELRHPRGRDPGVPETRRRLCASWEVRQHFRDVGALSRAVGVPCDARDFKINWAYV